MRAHFKVQKLDFTDFTLQLCEFLNMQTVCWTPAEKLCLCVSVQITLELSTADFDLFCHIFIMLFIYSLFSNLKLKEQKKTEQGYDMYPG